jgi:putative ABC transport system permease protein
MAISVRERTPELGILKAIGFSGRAILFFILAESLIIALAGGLLGLSLALLAVPALARALNGMLPRLILEPRILVMGLVAALAVGIASGILPGLGAMRMRVVNALRRV